MRLKFVVALIFCVVATSGCYIATIETGLPPSDTKVVNNWAACFIYGLVPPKTVETAAKCPHGVAKVVTQHSFLNGLVAGLTLSIFTPMTIEVTCARASEASRVDSTKTNTLSVLKNAPQEEFRNVFLLASDMTVKTGNEIFVRIKDNDIKLGR